MTQIPIIEKRKEVKYMVLLIMVCFILSILTIILAEQIENLTQIDVNFYTLTFVGLMIILLLFLNLMKNYLIVGKLIILKDDLYIQIGSEKIEKVKIIDLNINNYKGQSMHLLLSVRNFFPEENGMRNHIEIQSNDDKRKFELLIENERIFKELKRIKQTIKK